MKIVSIFAPYLYAIQYDNAEEDVYTSLLNDWNDVEFRKEFYEEHLIYIQDNPYIRARNIQEFSNKIERYATDFDESLEIASETNSLNEIFEVLSVNENFYELHSKRKAKNSFLRIYCIKVESAYIITGGAIKLTQKMQGHSLTNEQLKKLEEVKEFLKNKQITDEDSFYAYLLEQEDYD
ncbi:hypothetical protein GO491_06410 [Flavobacteriaceae bacterium Ap0902]|nr:hypothetical protein [Flavobacteriaceae bacterium Ap0902]